MSKVIPEPYYKCDMCNGKLIADRHFKIKVPVPHTKLKKWKRFDMCSECYIELYNKCNSKSK